MKKILFIMAGLMLFCTGCGDKGSDDYVKKNAYDYSVYESNDTYASVAETDDAGLNDMYGSYEEDIVYDTENAGESAAVSDTNVEQTSHSGGDTAGKLNREMLVYRGELSIDTLDFTTAVSDFKKMIAEKGGFVESESYSDSYSTGGYYIVDDAYKHNIYYATVRIPSSEYEMVMNEATNLGDVRNRTSNATNVTQQYSTYQSQLEIYEAEYERYLSLLESVTDDEYALKIENELFDIQIQMAELRSGITNIENDVAYSYIDITIKEVLEYEEEPAPDDTFLDRFKNTCRDSWNSFLDAMEDLLFYIVMHIYGIIVILVIVLVFWRILRKRKVRKQNKEKQNENVQDQSE